MPKSGSERQCSLWLLGGSIGRDKTHVTLPLLRDLGHIELRMSEIVRTLGRVEMRAEAEFLTDLLTTSSDLIRVRAPSREAKSASPLLEQAVTFVQRSRDLVIAAPCAAVGKRASYPTCKPAKATSYLSRVRIGQTERGGYITDEARQISAGVPSSVPLSKERGSRVTALAAASPGLKDGTAQRGGS